MLKMAQRAVRATAAQSIRAVAPEADKLAADLEQRLEADNARVWLEAAYTLAHIADAPERYTTMVADLVDSTHPEVRMLAPVYLKALKGR